MMNWTDEMVEVFTHCTQVTSVSCVQELESKYKVEFKYKDFGKEDKR